MKNSLEHKRYYVRYNNHYKKFVVATTVNLQRNLDMYEDTEKSVVFFTDDDREAENMLNILNIFANNKV